MISIPNLSFIERSMRLVYSELKGVLTYKLRTDGF